MTNSEQQEIENCNKAIAENKSKIKALKALRYKDHSIQSRISAQTFLEVQITAEKLALSVSAFIRLAIEEKLAKCKK